VDDIVADVPVMALPAKSYTVISSKFMTFEGPAETNTYCARQPQWELAVLAEYAPAGQGAHIDAPTFEYWPAAHWPVAADRPDDAQ